MSKLMISTGLVSIKMSDLPADVQEDIEKVCSEDPYGLRPISLIDTVGRSLHIPSNDLFRLADLYMLPLDMMHAIDDTIKAKAS